MARAPHETDASGKVVVSSHRITTRVRAEPTTRSFATEPMEKRKVLKKSMRDRVDVEDEVIEAEGVLDAAMRRTNRELRVFGQRLAAAYVTPRVKGEKSAQYIYVLDGKSASRLLPKDREERREELVDLAKRIENKKAGAETPKVATNLLKAMEREEAAHVVVDEKHQKLREAREAEEEAKRATVVAVRAMANEVQAKFAADPSLAREVLGYADGVATRRKNVAQQKKAAKEARTVEE